MVRSHMVMIFFLSVLRSFAEEDELVASPPAAGRPLQGRTVESLPFSSGLGPMTFGTLATLAAWKAEELDMRRAETEEGSSERSTPWLFRRLQLDFLGDFRYSQYNFTDLVKPYSGVDAFAVMRGAVWLDGRDPGGDEPIRGTFGPVVEVIPVVTTENAFFFQRHIQFNVGAQWYPFESLLRMRDVQPKWTRFLRPIRLFGQGAWRAYYDNEVDDLVSEDGQVGLDYYYDNLFEETEPLVIFPFTNLSYRHTNFSFDDYDALVWSGNVKAGPRFRAAKSLFVPYAVADWTYVSRYEERWFENFLRLGGGVRWYPWVPDKSERITVLRDLLRRFHFFGEVVHNVAWLRDRAPARVQETDFRFGFAFATGGFFRDFR